MNYGGFLKKRPSHPPLRIQRALYAKHQFHMCMYIDLTLYYCERSKLKHTGMSVNSEKYGECFPHKSPPTLRWAYIKVGGWEHTVGAYIKVGAAKLSRNLRIVTSPTACYAYFHWSHLVHWWDHINSHEMMIYVVVHWWDHKFIWDDNPCSFERWNGDLAVWSENRFVAQKPVMKH